MFCVCKLNGWLLIKYDESHVNINAYHSERNFFGNTQRFTFLKADIVVDVNDFTAS